MVMEGAGGRRLLGGMASLVLVLGSCTGDSTDDPDAVETPSGAPVPLVIAEGEVPIPPLSVDDMVLTGLGRLGSAGGFRGPIQVRRVGDAVVTATDLHAEGFDHLRRRSEPGPVVNGAASWASVLGPFSMRSLVVAVSADQWVELGSRDLGFDELAQVASAVTAPVDDPGAVPGDLVGVLHGTYGLELPGALGAEYERDGRDVRVTLAAATPAEQAAILALIYDNPQEEIDVRTEPSCCSEQVLVAPRQRTVRGASATIGTLTPFEVALVVEGDPGLVVLTRPPQAGGEVPVDDQIVAIAEGVRSGPPERIDEVVEEVNAANLDRQVRAITEREEDRGWSVVAEHRDKTLAAVITTGTERHDVDIDGPAVCAVLHAANPPPCLTAGPGPDERLTQASPGTDSFFGAIGEDVHRVDLAFSDVTISADILELDVDDPLPTRVFLALLTLEEQAELTESFVTTASAVIIARDEAGRELASVPMYPQLQG